MANEQSQNGREEYWIDEVTYAKGGLLLMVDSREFWTLKPTLWTSQFWTLINNFVIVLVCTKCSKLITLKENVISAQQLPLYPPLFFAFCSEFLNSGIKSCFDGVVFQDAACEECFSYVFGVFTLGVFYCFYESFIHKIILVIQLLPLICISYPLKVFKFVIGILRNSCAVPLLETLNRLP